MQDAGSGVLTTIEDFMWYKLALVRPSAGDGPSTSGYFSGLLTSSTLFCISQLCMKGRGPVSSGGVHSDNALSAWQPDAQHRASQAVSRDAHCLH